MQTAGSAASEPSSTTSDTSSATSKPTGAGSLFAAARRDRQGRFSVAIFDADAGVDLAYIELPARGHDITVRPPGAPAGTRAAGGIGNAAITNKSLAGRSLDCVAFARRPGNFAVVFNADPNRQALWFTTRPDRHFYGHGVFSRDGRLLFTTENDFDAAKGIIGVRDADQNYKQIGEFESGGIGPHDLALLSDNKTIVIANGGIETHPGIPRRKLNLATMRPNLSYVDITTGDLLERHELSPELHQLSIRHLSVGAHDTVIFGCQFQGAKWKTKQLIGRHQRGSAIALVQLPDQVRNDMRNYCASVEVDRRGDVALITAPRGGFAIAIEVTSGKFLARHEMNNVFGVAARATGAGFILTSGSGNLASLPATAGAHLSPRKSDLAFAWDNHLVSLG